MCFSRSSAGIWRKGEEGKKNEQSESAEEAEKEPVRSFINQKCETYPVVQC